MSRLNIDARYSTVQSSNYLDSQFFRNKALGRKISTGVHASRRCDEKGNHNGYDDDGDVQHGAHVYNNVYLNYILMHS